MNAHVHLRPGSLIAFQNNADGSIKKIESINKLPISIIANRDESGTAQGSIYLGKGVDKTENYEYYKLTVQAKTF